MRNKFDVIIVGAGPAGCACAIQLSKMQPSIKVALLEKGIFPRDKICGDALSQDVLNQIQKLSPELFLKVSEAGSTYKINGVKIGGQKASFSYRFGPGSKMQMFTIARNDLDALLAEYTRGLSNITFYSDCEVREIEVEADRVIVQSTRGDFEGRMIIGADGAHSVVSRKLGRIPQDKDYHAAALRVYYENVAGLEEGMIELHYIDNIAPGYFWIFPLPENKANVGLGMSSRKISERKLNLRKILQHNIESHPVLRDRFLQAKPLETVKGFGLPLGGKSNAISGERFLLVGDAASLIDPLTGEGIANAIRSGRVAADHIARCLEKGVFSAAMTKAYDKEIYKRMLAEFKADAMLRDFIQLFPVSVNMFINIASKTKILSKSLMDFIMWLHLKIGKM
ncbi:MAG: NAD(P)/FAD-dependent oxidoreductase [Saprospiraceae bacterium]